MKDKKDKSIRISPEIHKLAKEQAIKEGIFLHHWLEMVIYKEVQQCPVK